MARTYTFLFMSALLIAGMTGFIIEAYPQFRDAMYFLLGALGLLAFFAGQKFSRIFLIAIAFVFGSVALLGWFNIDMAVRLLQLNSQTNILHTLLCAGALWGVKKSKNIAIA